MTRVHCILPNVDVQEMSTKEISFPSKQWFEQNHASAVLTSQNFISVE